MHITYLYIDRSIHPTRG